MNTSETYSNNLIQSDKNLVAKFSEYRSRVMLGDLPSDFLRIQLLESQFHDSLQQQQQNQNPNFLGHLTLTIAEAKLIKNSGPLGLLRMDPYVHFQIGHVSHQTPTASGGGKNPQWNVSYRLNLFKGMEKVHIDVFDQRSFTEDSFIGECDVDITPEVLQGQTYQHWYSLMGREENKNENQGDILIVMSFTPLLSDNALLVENPSFSSHSSVSSSSSQSNSIDEPAPNYSDEDVRTIQEMFPTLDRQIIVDLLDKYGGSKDLVVNKLLQNNSS